MTTSLSTLSPVSLTVPSRYVPGVQTTITVTIATPQTARNGFEVVPKNAANVVAGTLTQSGDGRTQAVSGYGMHTASGNAFSTWTMRWTPPAAGAGTVTFYAAGNASNNSFTQDAGDRISLATAQSAENLPPGAPGAQSPADGGLALSSPPSLVVSDGVDGNGDSLTYRFELCADASCSTVLETSPAVAPSAGTASWQPATALAENGQYYWRARANDGYVNGAYSVVRSFWLDAVSEMPGAVSFAFPLTDTTLEPGSATFTVTATTDPDPGDTLVYDFTLATDASFGNVVDTATGVVNLSGWPAWSPSVSLVEGTTYYVLAYARDLDGNIGDPAVTRFVAHHNDAPVAPSLNAPANGSVVTTASVVLSANLSADPDSDTLSYHFQLCPDAACASVMAASPAVATAPSATTVTWSTASTTENALHYWRVRAHDGYVYGPYMAATSFYVDTVTEPPPAPVIQAPAANGFSFNTLTPTLQIANGFDPDPSAPEPVYDFYVYTDAARTDLTASALGLRGAGWATTWTVDPPLADLTTYYLSVNARDPDGNRAAVITTFVTDSLNTAPAAPGDPAPNDVVVVTPYPKLTAAPASDGEGDTLTYYFSIDTAPAFTGTQAQFSQALTWPAWEPPAPLADRDYFWRVQAFDGGLYGPAADAWFTVEAVNGAPSAPVPQLPLDGGTVNTRMPALQTAKASDPENSPLVYLFEIATDAGFATVYRQSPPVAPKGTAVVWAPETALADSATYYWRVRARDAVDAAIVGPVSGTFAFTIVDGNLPPDGPVADDRTQSAAEAVSFQASSATDPEDDALILNYEVYLDRMLERPLTTSGDLSPAVPFAPTEIAWTRGTYYWRVRANDGQYYGAWSQTAKLTLTADELPFETGTELPATRVTGVKVVETAGGGCRSGSMTVGAWFLLLPLLWLRRRRLVAIALALGVTACGGEGATTEVPIEGEATYGYPEAQAIFNEHCIGCHFGEEAEAGLALDEEHAYDALVGKSPTNEIAADRGMKRIDPGKPETSFLLYKVSEPGLGEGERMPLKLPKLSDEQIEILRRWVAEGAKRTP